MNKRTKLGALVAAGLLTFLVAGTALADGTVTWDGKHGLTNGGLSKVQCDTNNTPYLYWIFTPGGNDSVTAATLTLGGSGTGSFDMVQNGPHGSWHVTTGFFALASLTASVAYTGSAGNGKAVLTISHGCATGGGGGGGGGGNEETTPPATDIAPATGTSGPSEGSWLLVVGLGVLLASLVVLTPARAKSRR